MARKTTRKSGQPYPFTKAQWGSMQLYATSGSSALATERKPPAAPAVKPPLLLCGGIIEVLRRIWRFGNVYVVRVGGIVREWTEEKLLSYWREFHARSVVEKTPTSSPASVSLLPAVCASTKSVTR